MAVKSIKYCLLACSSNPEKSMSNDDVKRAIEVNTVVGVISILVTLIGIVVTLSAIA